MLLNCLHGRHYSRGCASHTFRHKTLSSNLHTNQPRSMDWQKTSHSFSHGIGETAAAAGAALSADWRNGERSYLGRSNLTNAPAGNHDSAADLSLQGRYQKGVVMTVSAKTPLKECLLVRRNYASAQAAHQGQAAPMLRIVAFLTKKYHVSNRFDRLTCC